MLCFNQLYDTECPAVDVLNSKTLFYTYRYSIVVAIHQTNVANPTSSRPVSEVGYREPFIPARRVPDVMFFLPARRFPWSVLGSQHAATGIICPVPDV